MQELNHLIENVHIINIFGNNDKLVSSIEYNSKNVKLNSLFVAIKGENFDGHKFISEAIDRGANSIVCEDLPGTMLDNITYILVNNSRAALAELSNAYFDFPANKLNIIGITGTNGKTTITYLLNQIFQHFGKQTAIIGTTGIIINDKKIPATHTTPESLELFDYINQCVNSGVEYISMEVSSHSLAQNRVFGVKFIAAAFTNLTQDHLDYHKTMQEYADAKKKLFDNLSEDAIVVINSDDSYANYVIKDCKAKTILKVGRRANADYIISDENLSLQGIDFSIQYKNSIYKIQSLLLGKFNIDNLAQAFAIAASLGFEPNEICNSLTSATGAPGRMERYNLPNGAIAIIDYAHTPDALEKALQTLRGINNSTVSTRQLICVFGCGGNRDKSKRPKMGEIASDLADIVVLTNDNPRWEDPQTIFNDILAGIAENDKHKVKIIPNRTEAIQFALYQSQKNDFILIAGKGHEEYQIIGDKRIAFSDKNVIYDYYKLFS